MSDLDDSDLDDLRMRLVHETDQAMAAWTEYDTVQAQLVLLRAVDLLAETLRAHGMPGEMVAGNIVGSVATRLALRLER